jgi:excisionase family DNA binding protein
MSENHLSLENTPSYLLQLGDVLHRIEQMLCLNQTTGNVIEKPLTTEEAAGFLNLEIPTLYTLVQKRKVPFHKRGKKLYFFREELLEWIRFRGDSSEERTQKQMEEQFLTANKKRGGRI